MLRQKSSLTLLFLAGCPFALAVAQAVAQPYVVAGQCRYGVPNGGYELRMPDGRLRVVGAFAQGHMTGTFIFWSAAGARVAVMPFDTDARSGTVALWYTPPDGRVEAGRKLEAPYVNDRPHGIVRSWHPNGMPRAEYRYEHGALSDARAWSDGGVPLASAEAERLAARDATTDEKLYASLLAIIRENPPPCESDRPNGDPPRS
jgi:antitoxin component YwqK of YwqJK toxin-antitoxin module